LLTQLSSVSNALPHPSLATSARAFCHRASHSAWPRSGQHGSASPSLQIFEIEITGEALSILPPQPAANPISAVQPKRETLISRLRYRDVPQTAVAAALIDGPQSLALNSWPVAEPEIQLQASMPDAPSQRAPKPAQ